MSENALDHIELMPFAISEIDFTQGVDFVLLSEDRVYTALAKTLYVYSVRELTHPVATYPLGDYCFSALIFDYRLYLGSPCKFNDLKCLLPSLNRSNKSHKLRLKAV
jgi:hypothetical protein